MSFCLCEEISSSLVTVCSVLGCVVGVELLVEYDFALCCVYFLLCTV